MGKINDISDRKKTISSRGGLSLVEGGLRPPTHTRIYYGDFVMAEVTDTRLMGVIGLHVCRSKGDDTIHQFFYLDAEEYGIDEYSSVINCSDEEVETIKRSNFGALGGKWNELSEAESVYLIKEFLRFSYDRNLELPEPSGEYSGFVYYDVNFTKEQIDSLWSKICVPIRDDNELINYYLMRCTGLDEPGAARLSGPGTDNSFLGLKEPSTFFRNAIHPGNGKGRYFCEMLIDDGMFYDIVCGITVKDGRVTNAEKLSELLITPWEASLILRRDEYVIYNRFDGNREIFDRLMSLTFHTLTSQEHEAGTLYMIFNETNDHVRDRVYRLDRDTMAAVLLLDTGELVVSGADADKTSFTENMIVLATSTLGQPVKTLASYRFGEQVIGAFLDSGFFVFKDYLEYIQKFEEK